MPTIDKVLVYEDSDSFYESLEYLLGKFGIELIRADLEKPLGFLAELVANATISIVLVDRSWESSWGRQGENFVKDAKRNYPDLVFIGMSAAKDHEFGDKFFYKGGGDDIIKLIKGDE
jgi:DNA-binding NtrC family response regulator